MWEQKKGNTPQVYNGLYGINSGQSSQQPGQQLSQQQEQQLQQQQRQQQLQQLQHLQQIQQYQQMSAAMGQPLTQGLGQGLGPPPPYTPYAEQQQQQYMKHMSQLGYSPNQYMATQQTTQSNAANYANAYPYQNPGLYQYNPYQNLPPNSTVVMPQGFDAGARFDGIARPLIPPPPPGVVPNAAQLAAMQGQNAAVGQKKSSFLEGGSSGGYTFW